MARIEASGTAAVIGDGMPNLVILASGPTAAEAPLAEARGNGAHIWGLNAVHRQIDPWLFTHFFQMHRPGSGEGHIDDPDHTAWLESWGRSSESYSAWVKTYGHMSRAAPMIPGHGDPAPIYMIEENAERYPMSRSYPLDEVVRSAGPMGRKYFTSTIDFMFALAIHQGYTDVSIYGVDMVGDGDNEYTKMRQSAEYYTGVMQGRGIKYYLPQRSALCRSDRVYGYEEKDKRDDNQVKLIRSMIADADKAEAQAEEDRAKAVALINACKGGRSALKSILNMHKYRERGSQY
jgi:hypothetical protein